MKFRIFTPNHWIIRSTYGEKPRLFGEWNVRMVNCTHISCAQPEISFVLYADDFKVKTRAHKKNPFHPASLKPNQSWIATGGCKCYSHNIRSLVRVYICFCKIHCANKTWRKTKSKYAFPLHIKWKHVFVWFLSVLKIMALSFGSFVSMYFIRFRRRQIIKRKCVCVNWLIQFFVADDSTIRYFVTNKCEILARSQAHTFSSSHIDISILISFNGTEFYFL